MSEPTKTRAGLRGSAIVTLVLACSLLGGACSEPEPTTDADATTSAAPNPDSLITAIDQPQVDKTEEDPFAAFGRPAVVDAPATINETSVWLINRSENSIVVIAMAGASPVVVDTVSGADSVLVRIETRADSVELSASSRGGVPMGRTALQMDAEPKRAVFPR